LDLERLASPPLRVEVDEDDDSRTGARPRSFVLPDTSSVLTREAKGRWRLGLGCFARELALTTSPGEADDMEVGVELTLNGPGEYPVEGVEVDKAYRGVGVGRPSVLI